MKQISFLTFSLLLVINTDVYAKGMDIPETAKYHTSERVKPSPVSTSYSGIVNGVYYTRYNDGSASFRDSPSITTSDKGWSVGCDADAMTDKKTCDLTNYGVDLSIFLEKGKGVVGMTPFSHDYPGKKWMIRIGNGAPTSSVKVMRSPLASNLVKKMKEGVPVTVRYYSWPYSSPKDATAKIDGKILTEAMKYTDWALAGHYQPITASPTPKKPPAALNPTPTKGATQHMHGDRGHSHALPAQGVAHRHGSGAVGK